MNAAIGDFLLRHKLGQGTFSKVFYSVHAPTGIPVAVKVVEKSSLFGPDDEHERFLEELRIFSNCNHPFIAKFIACLQDPGYYYIAQEIAEGGDMLHHINGSGGIPESEVRRFFVQLISAIDYLHNTLHVAHRDIKAENVLLDRYNNIRLVDFGLSKVQGNIPIMSTQCGSPEYASPEMVSGEEYENSTDIWSLGVLTYAMAYCQLPFQDDNFHRLMQKIMYTEPTYEASISYEFIDLLKKMLTKDPHARITLEEIKQHPWVAGHLLDSKLVELDKEMERQNVLQRVAGLGYDTDEIDRALSSGIQTSASIAYTVSQRQLLTEQLRLTLLAPPVFMINMSKSQTMPVQKAADNGPFLKLRSYQSVENALLLKQPAPVNPVLKTPHMRIRVRSLGCEERRRSLAIERSYDQFTTPVSRLPKL